MGLPTSRSVYVAEVLVTFVFILFLLVITLHSLIPSSVVPASSPATEFSAERAMEHGKVIASEPHPTGSIANTRARDYILQQLKSLEVTPEVQKSVNTTSWDIGGAPYSTGTVENIIGRLPGANSTGAFFSWRTTTQWQPVPRTAIPVRVSQRNPSRDSAGATRRTITQKRYDSCIHLPY